MKRVTLAAGMESDDDSELDDIICPSTVSNERKGSNETFKPIESNFSSGNIKSNESNDEQVSNGFPGAQFNQRAQTNFHPNKRTRPRGVSYQRGKPRGFLNQRMEPRSGDHSRYGYQNSYRNQNKSQKNNDSVSSEIMDDLRYAVTTGNLETTKNILSKGIWIDTILKAGWTGLMYASSSGHSDVVSYFLENKADPNYHRDMYTPLMAVCAARKNEEDLLKCCSLLLKYGANVNVHERHFTTPLMFAAREGYFNITKELLDHGANLNLQDNRGKTALAWAASSGQGQIIRLLMEKGADPDICDVMGQSPVDLAYESGHNELVSLIQKSHNAKQSSDDIDSSNTLSKKTNGVLGSSLLLVKSKNFSKVGELELFLSGIGFSGLITTFQEHDLDFHDLLIMDEAELEKIGISQVGIRNKILEACKSVHKKEWQNSSIPNLKHNQYISCPDAVAMMANVAKHLKFISSTVIYLRQQIQSQPRILELAQDSANVHDLIDEMEDTLKNVHFLNDELRFLKLHLLKVQDRVQYIPADLIVETVPIVSQRKIFYVTVSVVTTAVIGICTGIIWKNPSIINSISTSVRLKLPF